MNWQKYIKVTSFREDWENTFSQYLSVIFRCPEGKNILLCIAKIIHPNQLNWNPALKSHDD